MQQSNHKVLDFTVLVVPEMKIRTDLPVWVPGVGIRICASKPPKDSKADGRGVIVDSRHCRYPMNCLFVVGLELQAILQRFQSKFENFGNPGCPVKRTGPFGWWGPSIGTFGSKLV